MKQIFFTLGLIGLAVISASAQQMVTAPGGRPGELAQIVKPVGGHARVLGSNDRVNQSETQGRQSMSLPTGRLKSNPGSGSLVAAPVKKDEHVNAATTTSAVNTRPRTTNNMTAPSTLAPNSLSQVYRIGVGDVLDVQLADQPTTKSTLFTVQDGGVLEYPLAGDPLAVAGLTTDEVATRLRTSIKVFENPRVVVRVRDYASHRVMISGLVANPGARFLRREVIPFYVVLAESQPRSDATLATISRPGGAVISVDLSDQRSTATLVQPGDEIKVYGAPVAYFYISGAISSPGQKSFHSGLTLTQAIIASGGLTRAAAGKLRILRQGPDGKLTAAELSLRQIESGKIADPVLQSGDRVAAL